MVTTSRLEELVASLLAASHLFPVAVTFLPLVPSTRIGRRPLVPHAIDPDVGLDELVLPQLGALEHEKEPPPDSPYYSLIRENDCPRPLLNPTQPLKNDSYSDRVKGNTDKNLRGDKDERAPAVAEVIITDSVPQCRHGREAEVISFHHVRYVHAAASAYDFVASFTFGRNEHVDESEEEDGEEVHNEEEGEYSTGGSVEKGVKPIVPVERSVEPGAAFTENFPFWW